MQDLSSAFVKVERTQAVLPLNPQLVPDSSGTRIAAYTERHHYQTA